MRTNIAIILILSVITYSCTKTSSPPPVVPPGNGTITITSISPAMPYADDSIIITGTGFNPDKTKDTVDFGIGVAAAGGFEPYINGRTTASKAIILSATATRLVIKAVNPDSTGVGGTSAGLDKILFRGVVNPNNARNQIRVRSGRVQVSMLTPFREIPWLQLSNFNNSDYLLAPNDSFEVTMHGVNSNSACGAKLSLSCSSTGGCTFVNSYLTFNGNTPQCNCDVFGATVYGCQGNVFTGKLISHDERVDVVHGFVPSNFFNTSYPTAPPYYSNARIFIKMKMENTDGRTFIANIFCLAYPRHP